MLLDPQTYARVGKQEPCPELFLKGEAELILGLHHWQYSFSKNLRLCRTVRISDFPIPE